MDDLFFHPKERGPFLGFYKTQPRPQENYLFREFAKLNNKALRSSLSFFQHKKTHCDKNLHHQFFHILAILKLINANYKNITSASRSEELAHGYDIIPESLFTTHSHAQLKRKIHLFFTLTKFVGGTNAMHKFATVLYAKQEQSQWEKKLNTQFNQINKKAVQLSKRGHDIASAATTTCLRDLQTRSRQYFNANYNQRTEDHFTYCFENQSIALTAASSNIINKHRNYKHIFANIGIGILTLGIFLPLAMLFNKVKNNHYGFFRNTSTSKKFAKVAHTIDSIPTPVINTYHFT